MKQWCRVKLKNSDLFLGESSAQEVERRLAPIENHDAAVRRAEHRFGRNWPRFAEIIEIEDFSEIQRWRGMKGGKKVTAYKRISWRKRFPLKWITGNLERVRYCVGARSSHHAAHLLEKAGVKRCAQTILNNFKPVKIPPWRHSQINPEEGVWKRDGEKKWHKIL